jgi:uncharacterized protein YhaN
MGECELEVKRLRYAKLVPDIEKREVWHRRREALSQEKKALQNHRQSLSPVIVVK